MFDYVRCNQASSGVDGKGLGGATVPPQATPLSTTEQVTFQMGGIYLYLLDACCTISCSFYRAVAVHVMILSYIQNR